MFGFVSYGPGFPASIVIRQRLSRVSFEANLDRTASSMSLLTSSCPSSRAVRLGKLTGGDSSNVSLVGPGTAAVVVGDAASHLMKSMLSATWYFWKLSRKCVRFGVQPRKWRSDRPAVFSKGVPPL